MRKLIIEYNSDNIKHNKAISKIVSILFDNELPFEDIVSKMREVKE